MEDHSFNPNSIDRGVPPTIADAVAQATHATKAILRDGLSKFGNTNQDRFDTIGIAMQEARIALSPVRDQAGFPITYWFTLFYGPSMGPLRPHMPYLEELYVRWKRNPRGTTEFQETLDELFDFILDSVVVLIIADCRDDNLFK